MVIRLAILMLMLFSTQVTAYSKLDASIDKNPVMENESLILTVTADDQFSRRALDVTALNADFRVVGVSHRFQTQLINSDFSQESIWTVNLMPKKKGQLIIPALTLKNISSKPIAVNVIAAAQGQQNNKREVFIETTVDRSSVYLQSAITYTSKLYLSMDFQRGSLTDPQMENANITNLTNEQDQESSELKNGVRYRVITRVYSITPQRSGKYTIEPPLFNAELVVKRNRSFFSGFNNTKPVSVVGNKVEIEVLPIPQNYDGQWLPSEHVVLSEQWQPEQQNYTVGDPITRVVTLAAIGVTEEQLPEINVNYPDSVKTYPDQSNLHSATRGNKLIAQRVDSIAIVPSKVGQLTLPEVKIPWFNTIKNKTEYATLPAKTINITAGAAVSAEAQAAPVETPTPADIPPEVVTEVKQIPVNSWLTWTFLGLWLLTTLFWLVHVRHLKSKGVTATKKASQSGATSGRTYWKLLVEACHLADAKTASKELVRWGQARWPEQKLNSAMEVALYINDDELIDAVKTMQQSLYGSKATSWQAKQSSALLKALEQNKNPRAKTESEQLKPLHPA